MTLKSKFLSLLFLVFIQVANGQSITNVRASQSGSNVIINYDFSGTTLNDYFITLMYSTDQGSTFSSSLTKVKGDVGSKVKPGSDKQITWEAEKEIGSLNSSVVFKVVADYKENVPDPVRVSFGTVGIIQAKRMGNNVKIDFYFIADGNKEVAEYAITDPPKITTLDGGQAIITSGKFGLKAFEKNAYNIECVKGVPVKGTLLFPFENGQSIIPSLTFEMYHSGDSAFAVFRNIPVE